MRLDKPLLERARQEARRRGITLTALIEQGLGLAMRRPLKPSARKRIALPVCAESGGTLPGVNLDRQAELLDRMEEIV